MPAKRITVTPAEATRAIEAHYAQWLAALEARPPRRTFGAPPRDVFDERGVLVRILDSRDLKNERLGSWWFGAPRNIPGPDTDDDDGIVAPPAVDYDCIGSAPNGDLFCAVRGHKRARHNAVWVYDHERNVLAYPVAESIAAFAFLCALEAHVAAGPKYYEPDAAMLAQRDRLDDAAYDALYDAASTAFEAAWASDVERRVAILSGRVAPSWLFGDVKPYLTARFVPYAPPGAP